MHEPVDPSRPAPFDARPWIGRPVVDPEDRPLGLLAGVHADPVTGLPAWAVVDDGTGHTALAPLRDARQEGIGLRLPYTGGQLAAAPHPGHPGPPGPDDVAALHHHYSLGAATVVPPGGAAPTGPAVTRYEERLRVGVQTVVTGRVRVRKRLVTEQQTITVPVTREEVTVEHVEGPPGPAGPGDGFAGEPLREQVLEVVRYEERVLVTTEVVPVERVRVVRHIVTTPQIVEGDVRREVVEVESDQPGVLGR